MNLNKITKATAVFVQDDDAHYYCIHEDDQELFNQLCNEAYQSENFDRFIDVFGENRIGGCPHAYRKQLK